MMFGVGTRLDWSWSGASDRRVWVSSARPRSQQATATLTTDIGTMAPWAKVVDIRMIKYIEYNDDVLLMSIAITY